jgi:hypothetical protein
VCVFLCVHLDSTRQVEILMDVFHAVVGPGVGKTGGGNSFSLVAASGGFMVHANGGCDMCAVEGTEMPDVVLGSCDRALVFTRSS